MKQSPNYVYSYEAFDGPNPFDPIKISGAISDPADYVEAKHGQLAAVIRYVTLYHDVKGNHLVFAVAFGTDMLVNTILGMPAIWQWNLFLQFDPNIVVSNNLRETFEMRYDPTNKSNLPGPVMSDTVPLTQLIASIT